MIVVVTGLLRSPHRLSSARSLILIDGSQRVILDEVAGGPAPSR